MTQWLNMNHEEMTWIHDIMTQWCNDFIRIMMKWLESWWNDSNQWHHNTMIQWLYKNHGEMTWIKDLMTRWCSDFIRIMMKWLKSMTSWPNDAMTLYESWRNDMNQWHHFIMIEWLNMSDEKMTLYKWW